MTYPDPDYPDAPAVDATLTTRNGRPSFRFDCPHCRRPHYHGAEEGHRAAHCHDPASPYAETGYVLGLRTDSRDTPGGGHEQ
jgi:hypothetical protein